MGQKVVINAERTRFYCWSWDRWCTVKKLPYCFGKPCQRMYVPPEPHWRQAGLGLRAKV